jgi:hypothetical protein
VCGEHAMYMSLHPWHRLAITAPRHPNLTCAHTCFLPRCLQGKDAIPFLESLVVGDVAGLAGSLSVFTNEKGGIIDDTGGAHRQPAAAMPAIAATEAGAASCWCANMRRAALTAQCRHTRGWENRRSRRIKATPRVLGTLTCTAPCTAPAAVTND